jgi:hypothetical protein
LDLKPQYPKKPEIIIENNFHKSTHELAKIILKKLKNNNY